MEESVTHTFHRYSTVCDHRHLGQEQSGLPRRLHQCGTVATGKDALFEALRGRSRPKDNKTTIIYVSSPQDISFAA